MNIEYTDGTSAQIVSDEQWKLTTEGPIRANNEYDGEEYDARMEMPGWDRAGFNDANWHPAPVVAATATSATSAASATAVPWTGVSGKPTVVSAVTWPGYPGSYLAPPASYQISTVTISGSTLVFTTNCNCNCGC